jgi:Holliday junction resolvasome RuvABC ATP-dependent DNA helicase subunit
MVEFLSANPGLRERFGFELNVKDYDVDELGGIYKQFAKSKDFAINGDLDDAKIEAQCRRLMKVAGFAGARTVRKAFTESILVAATRHPDSRSIGEADFRVAVDRLVEHVTTRRTIGFM